MIFRSIDPATGAVVWEGEAATGRACERAVQRAREASGAWRRRSLDDRMSMLTRFAELLAADRDGFAELISRETGKPLWDARGEVASMIGKVPLSISALEERAGLRANATDFGQAVLRHRPHGVMAVLGPYNFPGHLPNGHIVPALLAGNCVVFKPSEHTPAVGERLVGLLYEAGVPEGVVELVQGDRATAAALLECPINGVLFTGSAATGRILRRTFADRPEVILALELGGNNPLIAWDGDPEQVADIVVQSAYITSGQRCSCARRLIVPEGRAGDGIVEAVLTRAGQLQIGAWDEPDEPFMGPLVSKAAADTAVARQTELVAMGARELLPMQSIQGRSEAFVSTGVLDATGLELPDEEIFAPLLTVYRAPDFAAAIALANRTRFGLSAGLISDDDSLWEQFLDEAAAGVVNRNRPTTGASGAMPFGGLGESGNHRASAFYAADYCAHPVASLVADKVAPLAALPGMER